MTVTLYSYICWIRMVFPITCLFNVSKLTYETSLIQNRSCENSSQLFQDKELLNLTSQESNSLSMYSTTRPPASPIEPEGYDGPFTWSKMAEREFLNSYCSRKCYYNGMVTQPFPCWCFYAECFHCECKNPRCEFYGTCCSGYDPPSVKPDSVSDDVPQTTDKYWLRSNITEASINLAKDTPINVVCDGHYLDLYMSKRWCPPTYPDGNVRSKCENDIPTAELDIDTYIHVIDNITGYSFYNMYCAACNNVQQLTPWSLSVECRNFMGVYQSRTPGELFRLSLALDWSDCYTFQTPPAGLKSYSCDSQWFDSTIVDTCNVTGQWDEYDEYIAKACADISGIPNRVLVARNGYQNTMYKNIFCAACNRPTCKQCNQYESEERPGHTGPALWTFGTSVQIDTNEMPKEAAEPEIQIELKTCDMLTEEDQSKIRLPFSILLNFASKGGATSHSRKVVKCSQDRHWTSPDNRLLPLLCSPGKILTNGSCSTAFSAIRGLVYRLHTYYIPAIQISKTVKSKRPLNIHRKYVKLFNKMFKQVMVDFSFQITLTSVFSDTTLPTRENTTHELVNTSRVFQISWFIIDGFIIDDQYMYRDKFEAYIIQEFILNDVVLDIDTNTTLTFVPMLYPHRKRNEPTYNNTDTGILSYKSSLSSSVSLSSVAEKDIQRAILIEPHLNCAFVQFNETEYLFQEDFTKRPQSSNITLYFKNARITLSDRTELNMVSIDDDGAMRICHEVLNTKNLISGQVINNSFVIMSLYILTLVCIISSIICLSITLMTYFLFPVLRNIAGKNNICLCLSLLMAQLSLLATSHVPEASHICTILAVCTHFLWLSMFCWCFTCCFHMFCVFSAKTRSIQSTANSELTYMMRRVVACSVIPGLTVAGVITTNYIISGGQFIGYGNTTCFIDSQIILVSTLVAPLCLILLLNFIFFLITIIKIYNVRKLQSREFRKDDHSNLYIYIKLSSMTGFFWILSVISEATDNDPLRFIAIGLNGLQGVFIFFSYSCNRRVLNLYLTVLGLVKYRTTTLTSNT